MITNQLDSTRNVVYDYDANGNRIARYSGEVTASQGPGGTIVMTVGNTAEMTPFEYNIRDQLVKTIDGTGADVTFDYDAAGMRVKKITAGGETRYLYDDSATLLEYDSSGQTLRKYDYGYDLLSLTEVNTAASNPRSHQFYVYDGLGSTSELINDAGNIQIAYQYDAWGNVRNTTGSSSNPKQFTGHELDPETGLIYAGARYYDSQTGTFFTQDSYLGQMDAPPSLHRYVYAHANPLRYTDPTGNSATVYGTAAGFLWGVEQALVGEIGSLLMYTQEGVDDKRTLMDDFNVIAQNTIAGFEIGLSIDVGARGGRAAMTASGALGGAGFEGLTFAGKARTWEEFGKDQLKGAAVGGAFGLGLSFALPVVGAAGAGGWGLVSKVAPEFAAGAEGLASKALGTAGGWVDRVVVTEAAQSLVPELKEVAARKAVQVGASRGSYPAVYSEEHAARYFAQNEAGGSVGAMLNRESALYAGADETAGNGARQNLQKLLAQSYDDSFKVSLRIPKPRLQVPYGSTDLSLRAQLARRASRDFSGANYAVFEYANANGELQYLTARSLGQHSERIGAARLTEMGVDPINVAQNL